MSADSRPVKLAVVTQFPLDPGSPHGGVEAVSIHLVRHLARFDDLDVHVVTLNRGLEGARVESWEGATLHRLPRRPGSELGNAIGPGRRQIRDAIAALAPDLIHAHDTYGLMVKGIALPRVFTIHGFIYGDTLISGGRLPRVRARIWEWVEKGGWRDQPNIISISPYVRERLAGIARGMIYDIDNPISERFFEIERAEVPRTLFCAAVINARKNQLTLIEAVERLRRRGIDVELRLAGTPVDAGYGRAVEARIAGAGLQDHVRLLGRLSLEQVRDELRRASAFVLVSLEENSPMGIEEAMAAGVPVITSNRCGMPYMVRHGQSGFLVDPNDPDDIARRIETVVSDDALRAEMGRNGRAIARDRFHPAQVAAQTRAVYRDALERAGR